MAPENTLDKDIFGPDPLEITWKCLACGHMWHRSEGLPDACEHCGAPKTEFVLIEED